MTVHRNPKPERIMIQVIDTRGMFEQFKKECEECAAGSRGWVDCSKVRAERMGLQFASVRMAAEALGLTVHRHGGRFIATRKA